MVDAQNGLGPIKAYPRQPSNHHTQKTNSGLQEKIFHCHLCDVSVNSEVKLKQHISSRKHRERVAGKFPKPKFSKDLHNVPAQAMLLPLQKEFLVETRVLHNPTTGAMPFASPLPSLPPAAAPAIFQVPPLVHWLHQPPLGPMRISHGAMLFTPY
ncbi:zinc finger protein 385B-like [Pristis pectinata]|uniref:zinc finger protein 385B-like n=1 Tax=Pristis pectinata TaxID=685728 RepID=UPI00223D22E2|nr:zinc finger protein 385B-like [Pristis pectinata]